MIGAEGGIRTLRSCDRQPLKLIAVKPKSLHLKHLLEFLGWREFVDLTLSLLEFVQVTL